MSNRVEFLKQALAAMGNGKVENNEATPQKGVANVYPNPADRGAGTLNAPWGEKPAVDKDGAPVAYGKAVMDAADEGRQKMVERLFDSIGPAAKADQSLISSMFTHANERVPHSVLLRHGREKTASDNEKDRTLTDKVMAIVGRR
jgi:hypothetical protein